MVLAASFMTRAGLVAYLARLAGIEADVKDHGEWFSVLVPYKDRHTALRADSGHV